MRFTATLLRHGERVDTRASARFCTFGRVIGVRGRRARAGQGRARRRGPARAFPWEGEPHRLGVRFRTSESPEGPSTGEMCEYPEEWAQEVALVLMEELDTGLVHRARRSGTAQGVVELHYRPDW